MAAKDDHYWLATFVSSGLNTNKTTMTILRLDCVATIRPGAMSIPSTDCQR